MRWKSLLAIKGATLMKCFVAAEILEEWIAVAFKVTFFLFASLLGHACN
jgi:hypothetical protein